MKLQEWWLEHKIRIVDELSLRGPINGEWIGQECPDCGYLRHDILYVDDAKGVFHCKHCGQGGPVSWLVPDLVLEVRGLTSETIEHFEIEYDADRHGHAIPVGQGKQRRTKFKALPGGTGNAYFWDKKTGNTPRLYNAHDLVGDSVCIVEGEPDVWIMHQAGFKNVVSLTADATAVSKEALRTLRDAGVTRAFITYDLDEAGDDGSRKLAYALVDIGVEAFILNLPESLGDGGDITDLYVSLGCSDAKFQKKIKQLVRKAVRRSLSPQPKKIAARSPKSRPKPFIDDKELSRIDPNWRRRLIEKFVDGSGKYTDAPHDFHRGVGFFLLSAIYADSRFLAPMTGSVLGAGTAPNLYVMLAGTSTLSRKTTCLKAARTALRKIRPEGIVPSDFSPEALIEEVAHRDGNVTLLIKDELSGLLKQTKRKSGYHAQTPELLMQLYDGTPVGMTRRTVPKVTTADRPRVSILSATTPTALTSSAQQDDLDTGFIARFLIVTPSTRPGRLSLRHLTSEEVAAVEKGNRAF